MKSVKMKYKRPLSIFIAVFMLISTLYISPNSQAAITTYQAENAVLSQAFTETTNTGYTGTSYVNYDNVVGSYIEWTVNAAASGTASLAFTYSNGTTIDRPMMITVNGTVVNSSLSFASTGTWTTWNTVTVNADLNAGNNVIRATATTANGGPNVDKLDIGETVAASTYQAENATLYQAITETVNTGYTGTSYVNYNNVTGSYVEWTVSADVTGAVNLIFTYANGTTVDRPMEIKVNGAVVQSSLSFPSTGTWTTWNKNTITANLNSGTNTIRATATTANGGPNLDKLDINQVMIVARQMENLDRGVTAVKLGTGNFVSWRILGTEDSTVTFNLYRNSVQIASNLTVSNYTDLSGTTSSTYTVAAVISGTEQSRSSATSVLSNNYLPINVTPPAGGTSLDGTTYTYNANDCSIADLDGDHQYEVIVKWDPSNSKDNSKSGYTGNVYLDAYKLNGTRLWRIDLGINIRAGAHYTQFMVYDLNGDGKAELVCKTADQTKDGKGTVIGSSTADYRNSSGYILSGPEYLTVFQGTDGKALTTINYEPGRGTVADWGDGYGNRVDRFLAGIAYLDGVHPSVVMCRGYYTRCVLVAYDWNGSTLTKRWTFDSNTSGNSAYAGQGNHNLSVADVDNDGKDEIIYGSCAINDDGTGLYSNGLGHGDALHVSDLDPTRAGLEVFKVLEDGNHFNQGEVMFDADTGAVIWSKAITSDVGRAMSAHIDPRYVGDQMWIGTPPDQGSAAVNGLLDCKGNQISTTNPGSANFAIWWDGDLLRELLDHNFNSTTGIGIPTIGKWDYVNQKLDNLVTFSDCVSNNWSKGNPCLQGDIFGDWREEVILRNANSTQLRIYTTTIPTSVRMYTLMHDPVYRLGIAWQNVAYNQPPHLGFYFGTGMSAVSKPNIYIIP